MLAASSLQTGYDPRRLHVPFIRTLLGDIAPEEMGVTYCHDHIFCTPPLWHEKGQDDLLLDDFDASLAEVESFRAAGGKTIYDATAIDYGRDLKAVRRISERTGVQIIGTAGLNKDIMWPGTMPGTDRTFGAWLDAMSVAEIRDMTVADVVEGEDGIRCGVVKFGTGYNTISPLEEKVMVGVLAAHKETGAPVHSHTELGTMALEQLEIVRREGVDPSRLTIAHLDRNPDPWMIRKVADSGAFMSFDGIARVKYYPESVRIGLIIDLCRRGHEGQVMIGGDIARKTMFRHYGKGGLGMAYILEKWCPRFVEEAGEAGLDGDALLHRFLVVNPQKAFAFA
jgi:predicted metal-dependent phosphotriesterase family hydrolase